MIEKKIESTAQLNEMNSHHDISILPIKVPNSQPEFKQCRICFSNGEDASNKMISPCECSGSLKFVHQNCLKEWLHTRVVKASEADEDSRQLTDCQICKTAIPVRMQMMRRFRSCQQIKQRVDYKLSLFIICMVGLFSTIAVLIYTSIELAGQLRNGYSKIQQISKGVVIASFPINILLLIYFIYNLGFFLIRKQFKVQLQK